MAEERTASKGHFVSLRVKLLVGFTLLFTVVFALAFYWFYSFTTASALQRVQEDLKDTLSGAAAGVDAEQFVALAREAKPRADGYTDDPRYWQHVAWLGEVHQIEPRAWVYTYVKGQQPDEVLFIGSNGALLDPPLGAKFLESHTSQGNMLLGLQQTVFHHDFQPYEDKWGKWVTGYTPIKDKQGTVVGALGIDFQADYVYDVQQKIRNQVVRAFAVTYVALFALVYLISLTLSRPITRLTHAARRIGEGDYEQSLDLRVGRFPDEIATLAAVFAVMVGKVRQREQSLRRQVEELRIEIDVAKRQKQVSEIVESDFFQDLQARARALRLRKRDGMVAPEAPVEPAGAA